MSWRSKLIFVRRYVSYSDAWGQVSGLSLQPCFALVGFIFNDEKNKRVIEKVKCLLSFDVCLSWRVQLQTKMQAFFEALHFFGWVYFP